MLAFASIFPAAAANDAPVWPPITSQTRPWAYWWWMGSAVDRTNLTRELERYQAGGLGGVHIIPIYGARGSESNYITYLSPKWMEMMSWSVIEARRLDMGVDMTTGTGWCFGGPQVTDDDANASVVVKTLDLAAAQPLTNSFDPKSTQALMAFSPDGRSIDLTGRISAAGSVDWTAPAGSWKIYAISQKPSGQKVKRPAPGGEGWMLNLIYAGAMSDYLRRFSGAFNHYSGAKPRAMYHDSYEYRSDWSPDFFAQFEKLRGYKLQTELPALFGTNADDRAARVKSDYRQTVSDIMAGQSLPAWVDWSHAHGFITRDEAHGSPGNLLDLYAAADVPETEFFGKKRNPLVSKFASSAAHVAGHPLVASETCTWLAEHFTETLAGMKTVVDDMFLSGVNHVFYHGCCYSPDEAGWPGWHFYAATEMNPRNSIWHDAPALNDYVARCQSILQSGKSDNDVLLYWPIFDFWNSNDPLTLLPQLQVEAASQARWFEGQPIGKAARELWDGGYAFDYVSDRQLQTAREKNGQIQTPGGNYRVVVVPECKFIPLETLEQLLALAKKGATVIFENQLPADVPGWADLEPKRARFKQLLAAISFSRLQGPKGDVEAAGLGKGRILYGDFALVLPVTASDERQLIQSGLSFVRRSFDGGWHYFIVNHGEKTFDNWLPLAHQSKSALILDPMTGKSGVAAARHESIGTEIYLQLQPGESVILRAFANEDAKGTAWNYLQTSGQPIQITGQWNVNFIQGGPTIPAPFQSSEPVSWTASSDTNAQAFAGTATYSVTFNAPGLDGGKYFLDLGDVRQSARVKLNGTDYGTLIAPPFRVLVDNLKPAGNELEVEVTGVAANRIRDLDRRGVKWKIFRDINFVDIDYKPFDASKWPLTDCGLLGPVTLTAAVSVTPSSP